MRSRTEDYQRQVKKKFFLYNSLFLNLPYARSENVGKFIPLLVEVCKHGLENGKSPTEIMDAFFDNQLFYKSEQDKIAFMFRVIQYVERQIVLFDSVEDAAFPELHQARDVLSIEDFFQSVDNERHWDKIRSKLSKFSARPVFTAHPTQFYSPVILDIIKDLSALIQNNKISDIDTKLQQLGLTSLINTSKPSPLDEARNILYFLRYVYYDAIGALYTSLKEKVMDPDFENYNLVKLGFWPGGDRDGNPFVTPEITIQVADELRMTLMKCYYHDVKLLQKKLTFRKVIPVLDQLRLDIYKAMFNKQVVLPKNDILEPLVLVRDLIQSEYHHLFVEDITAFIDKVHLFGTHFATLDIRQDHSVHVEVMTAILKYAGYIKEAISELDDATLTRILIAADHDLNPLEFDEEIVQHTLSNIRQLKDIQNKNGEVGCNRYIISNSEDIFSVLFVYALFRWSGWDPGHITVDIVPLFETMKGMSRSNDIMIALFKLPEYRRHVASRDHVQTIMLGFSDGTKDGGYLKANWSIFKTKENLSAVCRFHDIKPVFFDGRGGPPSRGGGKTQRFYATQSPRIDNHEIQLTIQGQTISSLYGTQERFSYNIEQLIVAALSNTLYGESHDISEDDRALLESLSERSFEKYDELKQHQMFIPYLEEISTLKYYSKANIGSRPSKRGQSDRLTLKDLRAISFVGSWSQLKQNVPGYYGIGTALYEAEIELGLQPLQALFKRVPFFKSLIQNSMMSLSKSYFELTRYLENHDRFGAFWLMLYNEYVLTRDMLLKISGYSELMEEEPVSLASIKIREDIVLPLLVVQQYALQKVARNVPEKDAYAKMVSRSLYGNINASRNSA